MLSILIPTFNYNALPLATILQKQCTYNNVDFEILVFDDGSKSILNRQNDTINKIKNCEFKALDKNIGRTALRNCLANNAKYNNLLFIDADTLPKSKNFITKYIKQINLGYQSVFGGYTYYKTPPNKDALLRWKYGKTCEEVKATTRNKQPYKVIISGNMLIKKNIFQSLNNHMQDKMYGLDNYFGSLLKKKKISVFHIDNELFHLGIEKSEVYLNKKEQAAETLIKLSKENKLSEHSNSLLFWFSFFKTCKLNYLLNCFYVIFNSILKKNLLGDDPSIKILQLYRLSYMCYKDLK